MGKKKPQKTKELSVAIAEASSTGDEGQQQSQPHTPRKRGRPRKIIEKIETAEEQSTAQTEEPSVAAFAAEDVKESQSKKAKASEDEDQQEEQEDKQKLQEEGPSSATLRSALKKEEGKSREPSRSRARRKSKPRKSS